MSVVVKIRGTIARPFDDRECVVDGVRPVRDGFQNLARVMIMGRHPSGELDSVARGRRRLQAGWSFNGSRTTSSFWSGTTGSWVDLSAFLPA